MAKTALLVDTDIFIDYFNSGRYSSVLDSSDVVLYYSVVTKKELLAKRGLREAEERSILEELKRFRMVAVTDAIARRFSQVRANHPSLERADALIAASALVKRLVLLTGNRRHFRLVTGLALFDP